MTQEAYGSGTRRWDLPI